MHALEPNQTKLKEAEVEKLLSKLNISPSQLPKIKITDPCLPEDTVVSDIIKIDRVEDSKKITYYRVVSV